MIGNLVSSGARAANFAAALIPNFGNKSASLFLITLFLETLFRNALKTDPNELGTKGSPERQLTRLTVVSLLNGVQLATCLVATSALNSYKGAAVAIVGTMVLSLPRVWRKVAEYTATNLWLNKPRIEIEQLRADRPSLYLMLRCGMVTAYVAAKVIQSLAVGVVAKKAFKAGVGEGVQFGVSAVLLSVSFYNVLKRRELLPL